MSQQDRLARISAEAAEWWLRGRESELNRVEREEFVAWLRESPRHVEAWLKTARLHAALEGFEGWAAMPTEAIVVGDNVESLEGAVGDRVGSDAPQPRAGALAAAVSTFGRRRRASIAVALAAGAAAVTVTWLLPALDGRAIRTETAERREMTLADGSVLTISPETRLRVRMDEQARRIVLEEGETLFEVAKDASRPFLVEAGSTTVRAVGTSFGVEKGQGGVTVTVAEGRVAVQQRQGIQLPFIERPPVREIALSAGQQIAVQRGELSPVKQVDTARALAWAEGRLVFENESLAAVVTRFNRHNRTRLRIADPELAARPVSGVFDAADTESFIAFLETTEEVTVSRHAQVIEIARRRTTSGP